MLKEGHRDGKTSQTLFNRAVGIVIDSFGNIFVADTEADLIRRIDKKGMVFTIGGQYLVEKAIDGHVINPLFFTRNHWLLLPMAIYLSQIP